MRRITKIILHCSATPEGKDFTVADIDRWHRERGFKKIGYHYVIYRNGEVHQGRKEEEVGAHCIGYNNSSIGVCYIGGLDKDTKQPRDTRTVEQKEALYRLVKRLMDKYELTLMDIHCHYEYANKACPCFDINDFRNDYLKWVREFQ